LGIPRHEGSSVENGLGCHSAMPQVLWPGAVLGRNHPEMR